MSTHTLYSTPSLCTSTERDNISPISLFILPRPLSAVSRGALQSPETTIRNSANWLSNFGNQYPNTRLPLLPLWKLLSEYADSTIGRRQDHYSKREKHYPSIPILLFSIYKPLCAYAHSTIWIRNTTIFFHHTTIWVKNTTKQWLRPYSAEIP